MFWLYAALLPGSIVLVALGRVPAWGLGFGGVLLILQGGAMLAWMAWGYGRAGLAAALLVLALGFGVEYLGETSGVPFGRYRYTEQLQPQLLGVVPLPITMAWLMSAAAAYEIARQIAPARGRAVQLLAAATLILLLDLQIETVATQINSYWEWIDHGPYYSVPTANFVAWWCVGLIMSWALGALLGMRKPAAQAAAYRASDRWLQRHLPSWGWLRRATQRYRAHEIWLFRMLPLLLYTLSTVMFTIVNAARGYLAASAIGLLVLVALSALAVGEWRRSARRSVG